MRHTASQYIEERIGELRWIHLNSRENGMHIHDHKISSTRNSPKKTCVKFEENRLNTKPVDTHANFPLVPPVAHSPILDP